MAAVASPAGDAPAATSRRSVPRSEVQVLKLTRFQLREYLLSRRFVILILIIAVIGAIITAIVAHFRGSLVSDAFAFYGTFWGTGANIVIVLAAVFFGGDAIAGEFQYKTGYFLMGLPIRRGTVYIGKYIAAFLASVGVLLVFFLILVGNGLYYFGSAAFPWQLGVSLVLAITYLVAVLGATFLFSSLFKTGAYGFVLTAILFLFGFTLLQDLVAGLIKTEPWMVISYANAVIGNVFANPVVWGVTGQTTTMHFGGPGGGGDVTTYTPGIAEGVVIMLGYFLLTAVAGLVLFEREEFT